MPPSPRKRATPSSASTLRAQTPALRDVPDIRDLMYTPTLAPLPPRIDPPKGLAILDQGQDGACTGFALAAVIHRLLATNQALTMAEQRRRVSAWMLYAMARRHDEWPGEAYEGSSLRGALRGFFNTGACQAALWPSAKTTTMTIDIANDARGTALGAYYRLRPSLPDYHAALSETGVVYVSAAIHDGWANPKDGHIVADTGNGLHAFALVGYDQSGFWVQNSWGKSWAKGGLAHWSYADWARNIQDAWVLQLAVPAPNAFGLTARQGATEVGRGGDAGKEPPRRGDILGHYINVRNGDFVERDRYWSDERDVRDTAALVAGKAKHRHLLIYAHGGLNTADAAAKRTRAMTPVFMRNGVYPYAIFYNTGLPEALSEVLRGKSGQADRAGSLMSDLLDTGLEHLIGGVGTRLWRAMKADARLPFEPDRAGSRAIRIFAEALAGGATPTSLHLVGHSTGAVLLGHLLAALDRELGGAVPIESCTLMAPACTLAFARTHFLPRLGGAAKPGVTPIGRMGLYNLTDEAETDDTVAGIYRKSLLYLVSNAFEEQRKAPILGMDKFVTDEFRGGMDYALADSTRTPRSQSRSHGGFDNDPATMNDLLRRVLGAPPVTPFTASDLDY
jgi:hypothetical protein